MSDMFYLIGGLSLFAIPVALIVAIIEKIKGRNSKRWFLILGIFAISFVVFESLGSATECKHQWGVIDSREATCTIDGFSSEKCSLCGEEKYEELVAEGHKMEVVKNKEATCKKSGEIISKCVICEYENKEIKEVLEHNFIVVEEKNATCEKEGYVIQKCEMCSLKQETKSEATGHNYITIDEKENTCEEDGYVISKCSSCNKEKTETVKATGHNKNIIEEKEATCSNAGYIKFNCDICDLTLEETIDRLEHKWKKATCEKPKTCSVCGKTKGNKLEHKESEWKITQKATAGSKGERVKKCTLCGKTLKTEKYSISAAEYKSMCKSYSYETIARNPNKYKGEYGKFYGKVVQVMEETKSSSVAYTLRVALNGNYNTIILVTYVADSEASHILEDDYVTLYGEIQGTYTYETVRGDNLTIPYVHAEYITIH